MKASTFVHYNQGLVEIAYEQEKRIRLLEKRVFQKRAYGMSDYCDAPACNKKPTFQCGRNYQGEIGNWCTEAHFKKYVI
jgi:hypothetical protein